MDNSSSTPLADYFWIAGLEKVVYDDGPSITSQFDDTIVEDGEGEEADASATSPTRATARHSRQNSGNRLSKLSFVDETEGNTRSNRSSATIRAVPPVNGAANTTTTTTSPSANGVSGLVPSGIDMDALSLGLGFGKGTSSLALDFDFDKALVKFAAERENFLDDLSFSAGAKVQSRPMINPRAEKLKVEEGDFNGRKTPLKSLRGSIRRKMSFKDMASVKRQPITARAGSIRTTRRLSNYNSVMPTPEPLNTDPEMHPLRRRFEPVLLDRYPPRDAAKEELAKRGKFPDYVPMFAFPNDIQVVSSDDRPRSTWHGFTMTSDDNSKIYGITIIVWTALNPEAAEEVEKRCERWRQNHMSNEERELAASLGVRLAAERAHLSQLLAKLATVASGTREREALDDQISAVEEKIGLMTEMLRPLRHGAASKIDGLTSGDTGLWAPRAFGILGRDATKMGFWKEWLRAVVVPMTDGAILRVPPSSPKIGRWQPLERYVVNLCTEAFSPISSKTQVELSVRELRLYARKEAANELPGARTVDIYALCRCLSLENLVQLFEYAMTESRIIFLSSHAAMLHLACHALANLLYPFRWASIFIPILPARLLSALEAPCPYVVGVERRFERIELPEDDYVLVDLDRDTIDATNPPVNLPRQQRRKLLSLLQVAAPHHLRYGVVTGPPPYAMESFPYDAFSAENEGLFNPSPLAASLGKWVSQNSSTFGEQDPASDIRVPVFNAFASSRTDQAKSDRPPTSKSGKGSPPSSVSPVSMTFPPLPATPVSRTDSGLGGLSATLREKRSGHFDDRSRRSSSFGMDKGPAVHRSNAPFLGGHQQSLSISAISIDSQTSFGAGGGYAPSTYAQSTIASTVLPNMVVQPVQNTENTMWVEGHCFNWTPAESASVCVVCDDRSDGDGLYKCRGCGCLSHNRCLGFVCIVCPEAFHPERVRAAFVRCMASLLYTYRKHLGRPTRVQKDNGQLFSFDMGGFIKSLPYDQQDYATMMRDTQAFNEFIHERERRPSSDPYVRLFDEILLAKKARGRPVLSAGLSRLSTIRASHGVSAGLSGPPRPTKLNGFLYDTTEHIWRTASVPVPSARIPGDYKTIVTRIPSKLDPALMREPRAIQGVPRPEQGRARGVPRKQVASMIGPPTPDYNIT